MVIHKRPPVREPRHEFGTLLDSAFDVQNQLFFGIVWLQGSDIIEQAAKALLLAILAEIVLADSACIVDLFAQVSALLNTQESTDGLNELDSALLSDFVAFEFDFVEEGFVSNLSNTKPIRKNYGKLLKRLGGLRIITIFAS